MDPNRRTTPGAETTALRTAQCGVKRQGVYRGQSPPTPTCLLYTWGTKECGTPGMGVDTGGGWARGRRHNLHGVKGVGSRGASRGGVMRREAGQDEDRDLHPLCAAVHKVTVEQVGAGGQRADGAHPPLNRPPPLPVQPASNPLLTGGWLTFFPGVAYRWLLLHGCHGKDPETNIRRRCFPSLGLLIGGRRVPKGLLIDGDCLYAGIAYWWGLTQEAHTPQHCILGPELRVFCGPG